MSEQPISPPQTMTTITAFGPTHHWPVSWKAFRQEHASWHMLARVESPLYSLPPSVIDSLAPATGRRAPLLSATDAKAERAFRTLCESYPAVGCWLDDPVCFPFLTAPAPPPPAELMQGLGCSLTQQLAIQQVFQDNQERSERLKGYVGWLLTEPTFLEQTRQLSQSWQGLENATRPLFPLERVGRFRPAAYIGELPAEVPSFQRQLQGFLDRWGLMQLSSWDLPVPQGPFLPNPLPPGAPALPAHGIHLVLPLHYPLQGDDHLMRQIFEFQRQAVRALGLDESLAGLPHFQAYAVLFDVLHLERVIRSRLTGSPPPGFVMALEQAITTALKCSLASVQKSRKGISACLRGQRSRVPWLRPRVR